MNISDKYTDRQLFEIAIRVNCEQHEITPEQVLMKTQKRQNVEARMMISNLLIKEGLSHSDIGRFVKKDHSTIIHYRNLHDDLMKTEAKYRNKFEKLAKAFRYEMVTGHAQHWRDFVDKVNAAYEEHGWGVEMLQFLYEMKKV